MWTGPWTPATTGSPYPDLTDGMPCPRLSLIAYPTLKTFEIQILLVRKEEPSFPHGNAFGLEFLFRTAFFCSALISKVVSLLVYGSS